MLPIDKLRRSLPAISSARKVPQGFYYKALVPDHPYSLCAFREQLLELGYSHRRYGEELFEMCRRDILFYISCFGWLLEPRDPPMWMDRHPPFGRSRVIPFIPRAYQANHILSVLKDVGVRDIIVRKSREVGETWMVLYLIDYLWRFSDDQFHAGLVSKDEDSVDRAKDPDSLMAKLDFINDHLPCFLRPPRNRTTSDHMIVNLETRSTISGFAATGQVARGGRKNVMVMDEFHFFRPGEDYAADDSTSHVTRSRIILSTVNRKMGASGAFYDALHSPDSNAAIYQIYWHMDPDKSRGLYTSDGNGNLRILDKSYKFPENYQFILDGRLRSPYYDYEWRRPMSTPQSIAAELDGDFIGASAALFTPDIISNVRLTCRNPDLRVRFSLDEQGNWSIPVRVDEQGTVRLWNSSYISFDPETGRLASRGSIVLGVDIAAGTGGATSSYSAIVGFDRQSGEQVIEWRSNSIFPERLAKNVVTLAKFYGNCMVNPESNGSTGMMFVRTLERLKYGHVYYKKRDDRSSYSRPTQRIGYHNSDRGESILILLRDAIVRGECVIRSELLCAELQEYVYDQNGKLCHIRESSESIPGAKGKAHGDVAIAAAVGYFAMSETPVAEGAETPPVIPKDSFLARRLDHQDKIRRQLQKDHDSSEFVWAVDQNFSWGES